EGHASHLQGGLPCGCGEHLLAQQAASCVFMSTLRFGGAASRFRDVREMGGFSDLSRLLSHRRTCRRRALRRWTAAGGGVGEADQDRRLWPASDTALSLPFVLRCVKLSRKRTIAG